MNSRGSKSTLPSLKPLYILEAMSHCDTYVGIREICEYTGYSQSTVHRILNEMLQCHYVEKNESIKKYKIGMESIILASGFIHGNSIVAAAREEMQQLSRATQETVHLLAVADYEVVYLDKIDTKHSLGLMSAVGKRNPIYCTSGGKAIAAFQTMQWLDEYLHAVKLEPCTENTLVDEAAFREELKQIRARGYALDNREHHSDIICVGAPIFDHTDLPVASISVAAPSQRFSLEQAISVAPMVMECARRASIKLGSTL